VPYNTNGWLDKNKDPINECVVQLMQASKEPLVAAFFKEPEDGITQLLYQTMISLKRIMFSKISANWVKALKLIYCMLTYDLRLGSQAAGNFCY
jgi:hypothetical protein